MKLVTLDAGTRDGRLAVLSRSHQTAVYADGIAETLQTALDNWEQAAPKLQNLSDQLNTPRAPATFAYQTSQALAPLPRAWQWLDASAFPSHGKLLQRAFNLPPIEREAPLMYQGMSHLFYGGTADIALPSEGDGIDFEGEFGIITDDVPMGVTPAAAMAHIKLLVLINDWSLRVIAPIEMKTGFGWIQAKPASSMGPVAVTPDELGPLWANGRVNTALQVAYNGASFGRAEGGAMAFGFHELIAHAAATRALCAGTVLGSGTVSNDNPEIVGSSCLAERRALDAIAGNPLTPFMKFGDIVRMEAFGEDGQSLFGTIDQRPVQAIAAS
jgi:fumarylacetoacetate (FAA) hydrolase